MLGGGGGLNLKLRTHAGESSRKYIFAHKGGEENISEN